MEPATAFERTEAAPLLPDVFARWFAGRGWAPRPHQLELLAKAREARSVLLIAPTGGGKTLAGFLPTLVELYEKQNAKKSLQQAQRIPLPPRSGGEGLGVGAFLSAPLFPPPPTSPHHSLRLRGEGSSVYGWFRPGATFAVRKACTRSTSRH